jgi:hypothetical protein
MLRTRNIELKKPKEGIREKLFLHKSTASRLACLASC